MAQRSTPAPAVTADAEQFPVAEVKERPRGKGSYSDGKPIPADELVVASEPRPYLDAITDSQRELLERRGLLPA
jgi:hypothetical protein